MLLLLPAGMQNQLTAVQQEQAGTHKSANPTQALLFLCRVTLTFDLLTQKVNVFSGLMVDHFYVKFYYPSSTSCVGF